MTMPQLIVYRLSRLLRGPARQAVAHLDGQWHLAPPPPLPGRQTAWHHTHECTVELPDAPRLIVTATGEHETNGHGAAAVWLIHHQHQPPTPWHPELITERYDREKKRTYWTYKATPTISLRQVTTDEFGIKSRIPARQVVRDKFRREIALLNLPPCDAPDCGQKAPREFRAETEGVLAGNTWCHGDPINLCSAHATDIQVHNAHDPQVPSWLTGALIMLTDHNGRHHHLHPTKEK